MGSEKIELEISGVLVKFSNIDEITSWAEDEYQKFSWVSNFSFLRNQWSIHNQAKQAVGQFKVILEEGSIKDLPERLRGIGQEYSSIICSKTHEGRWLLNAGKQFGAHFMAGAYAYFKNIDIGAQDTFSAYSRGYIDAALFERGAKEPEEAEAEIKEIGARWEENFRVTSEKQEKNASEFKNLFDTTMSQLEIFNQETTKYLHEAREGKENIEKTYDEHMQLSAPISYWEKKKTHHWWAAVGFGAVFLISLLLALFKGYAAINAYLGETNDIIYWHYTVVVFSVILFVWWLQVLMRLVISNIHLAEDAGERITMISTYLSFMKDAKVEKEEDRQIILQSLFKPAQFGLLKEESAPPSFVEMLKLISRSGNK